MRHSCSHRAQAWLTAAGSPWLQVLKAAPVSLSVTNRESQGIAKSGFKDCAGVEVVGGSNEDSGLEGRVGG